MSAPPAGRGTLYVVATPLGNLDDLSPRAVRALASSDLVACEDTRRSRGLLARHGLRPPLVSYHKFNERRRLDRIGEALAEGRTVSLVSDGGTPAISDPGALLVRAARAAGHAVVPIPGPSAVTTLLSVSGFDPGPFTFIGFLPARRGERRRLLERLRDEPRPLLFFESPRRIASALAEARDVLGDRPAFLGREMTKTHEEFLSGTLAELAESFAGREVRGEVAFLVAGAGARASAGVQDAEIAAAGAPERRVRDLVAAGVDRREALRRVARETGLSRRDLYRRLVRDRDGEEEE